MKLGWTTRTAHGQRHKNQTSSLDIGLDQILDELNDLSLGILNDT